MTKDGQKVSRRRALTTVLTVGLASFATSMFTRGASAATADELRVPDGLAAERWDFEAKGIDGWTIVT
ncbi:MAG TPA: hypothetical protein VE970_06550, partial [Pseudolabrys sp.]|nr:hypothetical protein [Pseudolabrys sp.]